ncbi:DUF3040 domain-containing protein [Streptomyces sp. ICN988]|uniref:DUF3040 domain-containing protein n=1 Tax=Streptomyces sp. ICN988 TaxID=2983765 RepID=UPI0021E4620A|nr:DUF3040 domain-containing protein [Streptomyces sp. ICN988]MCV2457771.1 DUF3040 domain-containing protein [Streptomyces sp. ICN988]
MDSPGLSRHEQQILRRIETTLEQDGRFGRRMHALERKRSRLGRPRWTPGMSLTVLAVLSLSLAITAVLTSRTYLAVAFGAVSGVAITAALTWLCATRQKQQP